MKVRPPLKQNEINVIENRKNVYRVFARIQKYNANICKKSLRNKRNPY